GKGLHPVGGLQRWGVSVSRSGEISVSVVTISQRRRSLVELRYLARLRRSPIANDAPPLDGQVWAALAGLPRRQAAALLLWSVFGHALAEIGVLLGCSEETARTHLRRARTRLREELDHV